MTTHLKPRSTTVALYQGDDMDRLAQLKRAVDIAERQLAAREEEAAQAAGMARAGDDIGENLAAVRAAVAAARDAFDEFVDDAAGRALAVELHSIGRRNFTELVAAHPPRQVERKVDPPAEGEPIPEPEMVDHPEDGHPFYVNTETFPRALLCFVEDAGDVPDGEEPLATISAPDLPTIEQRARFVDRQLAEGDFEQCWYAAWGLNRSPSADPKSLVYGSASGSTDET